MQRSAQPLNVMSYLYATRRGLRSLMVAAAVAAPLALPLTGASEAAPVSTPMKWHPGHYYMLVGRGDTSWYMDQVNADLAATPTLRGIVVRYRWAELESAPGVYDFSAIEKHLANMTTRNRRLAILLETKSFDTTSKLVPDYLKTATYNGGVFAYSGSTSTTIKGYNIKLWEPSVRDRLAALVAALGNRFNAEPNFEGFGLTETAMGTPRPAITTAQFDAYYTNLVSVNQSMRNAFPNTMTFQYTNHPRSKLASIIPPLHDMGATLGCPDVWLDDKGMYATATKYTAQGLYPYYEQLAGDMPLQVQVENANYENSRFDKTGFKPTVGQLLTVARDTLKVNYLFWTRIPAYYPQVLNLLRQPAQTSTPSGGLASACPAAYSSCITN